MTLAPASHTDPRTLPSGQRPAAQPFARPTSPHPVPAGRVEMVAIDLDGTLLRSDKRLSVRSVETLAEVCRRGVRVVLATARPPRSVREIYSLLKLDTLQINYNGAVIFDPARNKHVHHQPLACDLVRKIIKLARKLDPKCVVSLEILDKWYTDFVDETLPTETSRHFAPDFVGPLESFWHVPATKLMLLTPPARMPALRDLIKSRFQDHAATAVSDQHLLQIMHRSVDKSFAVASVAQRYGIDASRVMAIGDAPNDIGMLRWAGLGAAVANGWAETRLAADVVVPSNDDDGVAWALRKYVLAT